MRALALIVFAVLTAIAILHAIWGLRVVWPAANERKLVAMAVGQKGRAKMPPPWQCFAVGIAVFMQAVIALLSADWISAPLSRPAVALLAFLCAIVFLGRGVAGFTAAWRKRYPQQPFASLDREYYSPLCLALGGAFLLLSIYRLGWI